MSEPWEIKGLSKLKHSEFRRKPNHLLIPTTRLHYNSDNIKLFNTIYLDMLKKAKYYTYIERTSSGSISLKKSPLKALRQWDIRQRDVFIELTIINNNGMWRVQMAPGKKSDEMSGKPILSGKQAFFKF